MEKMRINQVKIIIKEAQEAFLEQLG